jgi:saccharopine dehydrogenase (NAD+, L-lysine forming)
MRVLLIGAGGVGEAVAAIAARRQSFSSLVIADYDLERAQRVAASAGVTAIALDASNEEAIVAAIAAHDSELVLNAVDPRLVMPIFRAALRAGVHYLDMAMSLSKPHPTDPWHQTGLMLGAEQFALHEQYAATGKVALVGMGVEPGLSDVFARYAADELFSRIDEVGIRDGANLTVDGYAFAPSFSIWTVIEECLNPPLVYERDRGWFTMPPFSEPEVFTFPGGIGPVTCVHVEHEEVALLPRWLDVQRATFKYGLGDDFIGVLQTLHDLGLDRTEPVTVGNVQVSPRDVVAASLPHPAEIGHLMHGATCAGTWVTGLGLNGQPREVYLYHVVDNDWTMARDGVQAVVWQTALQPVLAIELLAAGHWHGVGVLGPEAFPARPFLDLLGASDAPWGMEEREPGGPR